MTKMDYKMFKIRWDKRRNTYPDDDTFFMKEGIDKTSGKRWKVRLLKEESERNDIVTVRNDYFPDIQCTRKTYNKYVTEYTNMTEAERQSEDIRMRMYQLYSVRIGKKVHELLNYVDENEYVYMRCVEDTVKGIKLV